MAINEVPRTALAGATGVSRTFYASAADCAGNLPGPPSKGTLFRVTPKAGQPFIIAVAGRTRRALDELRAAGPRGCTPIDQPAPRWSAYVFNLRKLGMDIETKHEPHAGEFAGHHGRYILRCQAELLSKGGTKC